MDTKPVLTTVAFGLLLSIVGGSASRATVIAVDGVACTLGDAILSANLDDSIGGCTTGFGSDRLILGADIVLTAPVTATVEGGPTGLPEVSSDITIEAGAGSIVERSSSLTCDFGDTSEEFRIFAVGAGGRLSLVGLTVRNGCIRASESEYIASGGAVLVLPGGALVVADSDFSGNTARGAPEFPGSGLPARGGAIAVLGGGLEVRGSSFSENRTLGDDSRGGAIAVEEGEVREIVRSRFVENQALRSEGSQSLQPPSSGGGLDFREAEVGTLAYLEMTGNIAKGAPASGGAIATLGGVVHELRDSHLSGNLAQGNSASSLAFAPGRGGGLANRGRIDSIARVTFSANEARGSGNGEGQGGGLDNRGRIGQVVAATFTSNFTVGGVIHASFFPARGGGLANLGRIEVVAASSFVDNSCMSSPTGAQGGGIYDGTDEALPSAGLQLVDSLLAGNEAGVGSDCFSTADFSSLGFNLAFSPDASCAFAQSGDRVGEDPQLLPPADNGCAVHLPSGACPPTVGFPATSPAADAGRCAEAGTEVDARGAVRPFDIAGVPNAAGGDGCDIGAFERDATLATVNLGLGVADSVDPAVSGWGAGNLRYTVSLSSVGSLAASSIVVTPTVTLPTGVTLDSVVASTGTWNGTTWSIASLLSGETATLTFVLTVGFGTHGGLDVLQLAAAVTSAPGHVGELASDTETTSVLEGLFFDGFESGDASAWSQVVGGLNGD